MDDLSGHRTSRSTGATANRRRSERSVFSAVADVTDVASQAKLSVRVADLSLNGCYADSLSVFPVGTLVQISIRHSGLHLLIKCKVVSSKEGMGMGLDFKDLSPDIMAILGSWAAGTTGIAPVEMDEDEPRQSREPVAGRERLVLVHLLDLLMRKGLLTATEGAELQGELKWKR